MHGIDRVDDHYPPGAPTCGYHPGVGHVAVRRPHKVGGGGITSAACLRGSAVPTPRGAPRRRRRRTRRRASVERAGTDLLRRTQPSSDCDHSRIARVRREVQAQCVGAGEQVSRPQAQGFGAESAAPIPLVVDDQSHPPPVGLPAFPVPADPADQPAVTQVAHGEAGAGFGPFGGSCGELDHRGFGGRRGRGAEIGPRWSGAKAARDQAGLRAIEDRMVSSRAAGLSHLRVRRRPPANRGLPRLTTIVE